MLKTTIQSAINTAGTAGIGYGGALAVQQSQSSGLWTLLSYMPSTLEEWTAVGSIISALIMVLMKIFTAIADVKERKLDQQIKRQEHELALKEKELELKAKQLELEKGLANNER